LTGCLSRLLGPKSVTACHKFEEICGQNFTASKTFHLLRLWTPTILIPLVYRQDKGLPAFFRIVGWVICVICIVAGVIMVLAYGLQFGNDQTYQWVVSMLVSFLSSLVFTQLFKVLVSALILAFCTKSADFGDDHVFQDEKLPSVYYDENDPNISNNNIRYTYRVSHNTWDSF
jgi:hypothetical protein